MKDRELMLTALNRLVWKAVTRELDVNDTAGVWKYELSKIGIAVDWDDEKETFT